MWPQIVFFSLVCLNLGMNFELHGEDKTGKHNAWYAIISFVLTNGLLYLGGFYDCLLK